MFGVTDHRGDVKDGDNFLLDFIKNKIWVDREEEEAANDNKKRARLGRISEQGRAYGHLRGKVQLPLGQ